jgi:fibronectin type 3 domain-containing protein
MTLDPGQSATLSVQFDPITAGAATGELTIISNSSTASRAEISLSGTGALHAVQLTWNAPSSSSNAIAGYHIYRSPAGSSSYQRLNSSVDMETSYIDGDVESGLTYDYYVTDIDTSGTESAPSNMTSVMIP